MIILLVILAAGEELTPAGPRRLSGALGRFERHLRLGRGVKYFDVARRHSAVRPCDVVVAE
jgi:hypothetical protein